MASFAQLGNDLYTGRRSIDFIGKRRTWYLVSVGLILLSLIGIFGRGLNFGIEFRGGTQFRLSQVADMQDYESRVKDVVRNSTGTTENIQATKLGSDQIRVETEKFADGDASVQKVRGELAQEFKVSQDKVSADEVGESWGQDVSRKALLALVVFLVLVSLVLALYFRTWKMSLAALAAMFHDMIITVGIYALLGFEITPASVIGFLTILGYSLYDTVVVFDKVRENTDLARRSQRVSFAQAVNLAVNQTLVRSINTTVVALLPVAAVLIIGFTVLGPGTLLDLALALFIGMAVGAYSSVFLAAPVYTELREKEPEFVALAKKAARWQKDHPDQHIGGHMEAFSNSGAPVRPAAAAPSLVSVGSAARVAVSSGLGDATPGGSSAVRPGEMVDDPGEVPDEPGSTTASGRRVHPSARTSGPRNQPRRVPRSKR